MQFIANSGSDNAAIDDIMFIEALCSPPGTCDFQNGKCFYVNSKRDNFDWTLGSGYTTLDGPIIDHTHGGDPYGLYHIICFNLI